MGRSVLEVTTLGFAAILLTLSLFCYPERLLQFIFVCSVFGAASTVNIGEFGIVPVLIPAAVFVVFFFLQILLGARYPAEWLALKALSPLLVVGVYALITSYLMPYVFAGKVFIFPQKSLGGIGVEVLSTNPGNANQRIYLIVNMLFLISTAVFVTRHKASFHLLVKAYLISGFIAFGFEMWNVANRLTGLWFPSTFLLSNPGYAILTDQTLGSTPRINGTYTEPAALGAAMSAYVFTCVWLLLQGHNNSLSKWLLPCSLLGALITTSSTAILTLCVGGAFLVVRIIILPQRKMVSRIIGGAILTVISVSVMALLLSVTYPSVANSVVEVLNSNLDKSNSSSYSDRTGVDLGSLATLVPTYGLGVGWGSNRSSSLIPGLLASLGIYGFALLPWVVSRIWSQISRIKQTANAEQKLVLDAMLASISADIIAAMISGPSIGSIDFYLKLALVVGCASRVELDMLGRQRQQRWVRFSAS